MAVITISRQFGSGGDEIAARVCEQLGYRYFDKRLMAQVAAEVGLSEDEIVDISEDTYKVQGFLDRLLSRRRETRVASPSQGLPVDMTGAQVREEKKIDDAYSINLIQSIIQEAYQRGEVVIVGRGGQVLLKDKADVLHVRIEAPYRARVQRLVERENYSLGGAKDIAIKHDRAAAEYLKRYYEIDWADPSHYDMVLNTVKLDTYAAASLIASAAGFLAPSETLEDRS